MTPPHPLPPALERRLEQALAELRTGRPVVIPTDTVYGLAADPASPEAVEALFRLKGRPEHNPIPVLVGDADAAARCAADWPGAAAAMAQTFWPGPLTIVVHRAPWIPAAIVAGSETVGLRQPDHPVTLALLHRFGGPLACTSANRSGEPPMLDPSTFPTPFRKEGIFLLDAGPAPGGAASTVASALPPVPGTVLRAGPVSAEAIARALKGLPHQAGP